MADTNTQDIEQGSLEQVTTDAFKKSLSKQVSDQTASRLQQGQNPQQILSDLMKSVGGQQTTPEDVLNQIQELQRIPIPTGRKAGLINSLLKTGKLKRQEQTTGLSFGQAAKLLQIQQQQQAAQAGRPKQQFETIETGLDLIQKLGALNPQGEVLERDISGNLTTRGIEQREQATLKSKAEFQRSESVKTGLKDITNFVKDFELSEQEIVNVIGEEALQVGPQGLVSRLVGAGAEKIDLLPKTSSFLRDLKKRANGMARAVEGGRVTDQDRSVYSDTLANTLGNPSEENTQLLSK